MKKETAAEAIDWRYSACIVCTDLRLTLREPRPCSVASVVFRNDRPDREMIVRINSSRLPLISIDVFDFVNHFLSALWNIGVSAFQGLKYMGNSCTRKTSAKVRCPHFRGSDQRGSTVSCYSTKWMAAAFTPSLWCDMVPSQTIA